MAAEMNYADSAAVEASARMGRIAGGVAGDDTSTDRWAIWPDAVRRDLAGPARDAILADRWNGAVWPGGNASELALRLYAVIDELAGEVARVDMSNDGPVHDALDMDGLERVIGEWILERVGPVAA
jgi:hypothetical protein